MASSPTRQHAKVEAIKKRRTGRCESAKVTYDSKAEALDAAEVMMDRGFVAPGCHLTPYACERCGHWHVGNRRIVFSSGVNHV